MSLGREDEQAGSGSRYDRAYCLFCVTGKEQAVADALQSQLGLRALFPTKIKTERRGARWERKIKPLLPGYVFVYATELMGSFYGYKHSLAVRLLHYADGTAELRGGDRRFADWVWMRGGEIEVSKAVRIGERVEIVEGPLKEMQGSITALDKRKRLAKVELNVIGSTQRIWLSFDYIEASDD